MSLDSEVMFVINTIPLILPLKRTSPVSIPLPALLSHLTPPELSSPCPVTPCVFTSSTCRSSPWEIFITLHPATAEVQDSQFVCFTLVLQVPVQVRPLHECEGKKGRVPRVGHFNMLLFCTSIPMRCHRSPSVTPEGFQMSRSTSKLG